MNLQIESKVLTAKLWANMRLRWKYRSMLQKFTRFIRARALH